MTSWLDGPVRQHRALRLLATGVVVVLWAAAGFAAFVRSVPDLYSPDRGVFVSVAERLDAGDRLYVDVWDNKDPLFYYVTALGRLLTPLMDVWIELGWLAVTAVCAAVIVRRLGSGILVAAAAAAIAVLVTAGSSYLPGYSELPGTALALAAFALVVAGRPALAGLVLGTLVFTRLVEVPVAVCAIAVWIVVRPARTGLRALAAGTAVAVAAWLALLTVRGELGGWVAMIGDNVGYSQSRLESSGPAAHLSAALGGRDWGVVATILLLSAVSWWWARKRPVDEAKATRALAITVLAATAATIVVLAITGVAPNHAMELAFPAIIAGCLVATWLAADGRFAVAAFAAALVATWLLAAMPSRDTYTEAAASRSYRISLLTLLGAKAQSILNIGPAGEYARLGPMFDGGHAYGLRGWTLKCPRFHQYTFQSDAVLQGDFACASGATVLLVEDDLFARVDPRQTAWTSFTDQVADLLASSYDCTQYPGFRTCLRKGAA